MPIILEKTVFPIKKIRKTLAQLNTVWNKAMIFTFTPKKSIISEYNKGVIGGEWKEWLKAENSPLLIIFSAINKYLGASYK